MTRRRDEQHHAPVPTGSGAPAARSWAEENAEAISERRALIETNGTPLADLQVLRLD
jgi:antitoxin CcdA